eukprot:363009-Chlamydomonas_euryale.AAC.12
MRPRQPWRTVRASRRPPRHRLTAPSAACAACERGHAGSTARWQTAAVGAPRPRTAPLLRFRHARPPGWRRPAGCMPTPPGGPAGMHSEGTGGERERGRPAVDQLVCTEVAQEGFDFQPSAPQKSQALQGAQRSIPKPEQHPLPSSPRQGLKQHPFPAAVCTL